MAIDSDETRDGGILRDKHGRPEFLVVSKHQAPLSTDVPAPAGMQDLDGRPQIVLLNPDGSPFSAGGESGGVSQAAFDTEVASRVAADNALDGRLDTLEAIDYATQVELNAVNAALDSRLDTLETAAPAGIHAFNDGTPNLSGTLALDMTGKGAAIVGGVLTAALTINVTGTFAWGASIVARLQQNAATAFALVFQRNGVATSPTVRWGGPPPSPILSAGLSDIEAFVLRATPAGNLEISKAVGPFA